MALGLGQSIPSALAVRRSRFTASSGAGGSVRRMPTLPSIMIEAAAKPVSSEIWAFQDSTGSISRYSRRQRPSTTSTSCAGIGSDTPPRSASFAIRSSPTVLSTEPAWTLPGRRSISRCTPS